LYGQQLGTSYYGKRYPIQNTASALVSYLTSVQTSSLGVIPVSVSMSVDTLTFNTFLYSLKNRNPQVFGLLPFGSKYPMQRGTNTVVEAIEQSSVYPLEVIPIAVLVTIDNGVLLKKAKSFEFEFIGEFKSGDVIVIDSKRMIVTLNGENALHLVGKDEFPEIMPEGNEFLYSDISGTRVVRIRIKWQDRWL